jgi:Mg-chelatase subunit ChlD
MRKPSSALKKKVAIDVDGLLKQLTLCIDRKDYQGLVTLLYRIPASLNDVFNEDYLDELLYTVSHLETDLLQIKLLSMIMERADETRRVEMRSLLLEKILFLSRKIAIGQSGVYRTVVTRYRPGLDELDVDRTLEEHIGKPHLDYENIYCHEKIRRKSSFVLMLDISNSMQQEKIAIGAIATGVFASKLRHDWHGVLTFARYSSIVKHVTEPNNLEELMDRMLDVRSGGSTNLRGALLDGWALLNEAQTMTRTGILVTDGWATVGGDPVEVAAKFDRLHVLGISFGLGGSDPATNAAMARKGRGRYLFVRKYDDLPLAITRILTNRG